jgi:transposase
MEAPRTRKDMAAVRELLSSLVTEGRVAEAIDMAVAMLAQISEKNDYLTLQLAQLRRAQSGRRSEKINPDQLSLMLKLFGGEELEDEEEPEPTDELPATDKDPERPRPKRRARRARPPKHLPREVIRYELSEADRRCETCGQDFTILGEDVSEQLEYVASHFLVKQHRREKGACGRCKNGVKTAPGPDKLIAKGLPGTGLLAQVMVSKYGDHIPLTRQRSIYLREGVDLPVSTLCDWVAAVTDELSPIVDCIRGRALDSHLVQTDASGLKVLDRGDPENIRKGTMWCTVGDRKWAVFEYAKTGAGADGPWKALAGRTGFIQADASSVFDRLFDGQCANAVEVGCWAHARRKLFALKDTEPRVAYPLKLIGNLYKVESNADARGLDANARCKLRASRSAGILERLQRWLTKTAAREPPESALAKACAYSLNHWEALTRFLEDGRLSLDNNLCELQIRSLAVGRKNYLHAGSDAGAQRAAAMYTILRTCALHGVSGYSYLKDVLDKLAEGWPKSRIDELLPEAYAATNERVDSEPVLESA